MKYAPKRVFIISQDGYEELRYEVYCLRCEQNPEYQDKFFLPLHGMLMEVTEDDYKALGAATDKKRRSAG